MKNIMFEIRNLNNLIAICWGYSCLFIGNVGVVWFVMYYITALFNGLTIWVREMLLYSVTYYWVYFSLHLGPQCVLSCAKERRVLPKQGYTCCLALDGVKVLASGFDLEEKVLCLFSCFTLVSTISQLYLHTRTLRQAITLCFQTLYITKAGRILIDWIVDFCLLPVAFLLLKIIIIFIC